MHQLTQSDRIDLAARRICSITGDPRRLILVPQRLAPLFGNLPDHGGSLKSIDVRKEIHRLAQAQLGQPYFHKAIPEQAPRLFSCSTLTKWLYAQVGVWLPRYAVDQSYMGTAIDDGLARVGSLLFFRNTFPIHDPDRSIGHVAILVGDGEMIHGSWRAKQITREPVPEFPVRVCDPVPRDPYALVELPLNMQGVETALDVARWLQRL